MKKYIAFLFATAVVMGGYAYIDSRPDQVTITSDKWQCDVAVPKGLKTYCTVYSVRAK